jgi:hypothetical protein
MKHLKMIKMLIENGANLSIQSTQGLDSLHMACLIGESFSSPSSDMFLRRPVNRIPSLILEC